MLIDTEYVSRRTPPLPAALFLPDGQKIETSPGTWEILDLFSDTPIRLSFRDLDSLTDDLLLQIQHAIARCLETRSIAHSSNMLFRFRAFYRAVLKNRPKNSVDKIDLPDILGWKATLNQSRLWQLGVVRVLLLGAHNLGFAPCTQDALAWLNSAILPGNPKGVDVRTRNRSRGAFTAAEVEELNSCLNEAYANADISLSDYAVGHVLLAFGIRSRQIAALKEKDLIAVSTTGEDKRYLLQIPQAKQRGQQIRDTFKIRPCDRRLGRLLELLIEENRKKKGSAEVLEGEEPMFRGSSPGHNPPGFAYHRSSQEIGQTIDKIIQIKTKIKANPKRFRHTLAQNMADDGATVYEIAEALGHADTQQVGKYIEARPEMVSRLNQLAEDFTPIVQAFAGVLMSSQCEEARSASKAKLLHDRALESGGDDPLGHCGQHSFCDLAKPIGCYTCRSFCAWDDGPHDEILANEASRVFRRRVHLGHATISRVSRAA